MVKNLHSIQIYPIYDSVLANWDVPLWVFKIMYFNEDHEPQVWPKSTHHSKVCYLTSMFQIPIFIILLYFIVKSLIKKDDKLHNKLKQKVLYCKYCNYKTEIRYNYDRHLNTLKHHKNKKKFSTKIIKSGTGN